MLRRDILLQSEIHIDETKNMKRKKKKKLSALIEGDYSQLVLKCIFYMTSHKVEVFHQFEIHGER